jgi:hypothetical protein
MTAAAEYLTSAEAAAVCRVHVQTMRGWLKLGVVKSVRHGRRYLTTLEWIESPAGIAGSKNPQGLAMKLRAKAARGLLGI